MNRRNFILGLGTAATLSGAASVTGAALNNTVTSTADFQIVAENQLTVERNDELESENIGLSSANNYSDTTVADFNHTNAQPFPNLTVNSSEDGQLGMAFATNNTNGTLYNNNESFGGVEPYNGTGHDDRANAPIAPLQIANTGGTDKNVSVAYGLGSDVDTEGLDDSDGTIDPVDVAQLFTFEINGKQISPISTSSNLNLTGTPGTLEHTDGNEPTVTVEAGETLEVDFKLNYSDRLKRLVSSSASGGSYSIGSDALSDVSLLETVRFGSEDA